ncbi:metalloendoproteinase 5-MMP [Rosa chinensis]|uniref:metalloendoproteinase 5-MMP n=1 Tax=Rosa chinensis TaxID=74649 RepID=UPI000D090D55|nr:metalloendoproteinase 5-MMP [Rosa chinensis]
MAPKSDLSLFTVTLLLLLAFFSFLSNATANSSPFEFLEQLKGCHKGDKVKGVNDLKKYLQMFGYLNYENHRHSDDNDFDELLEEAIKTYQLNFHLKSTGTLDNKTISQMIMPRCGMCARYHQRHLIHAISQDKAPSPYPPTLRTWMPEATPLHS